MSDLAAALTIERMAHGGFVVHEGYRPGDPGRYCGPLFACTDIGDALNFVRSRMAPLFSAGQIQGGGISGLKGAR